MHSPRGSVGTRVRVTQRLGKQASFEKTSVLLKVKALFDEVYIKYTSQRVTHKSGKQASFEKNERFA
jgi:hypothetical protein